MRTEILYEDEHIIVAYKPAGLAVQTAKVGQADMASELKNYMKSPYLGIVHRLDQPVEGVLVFGKTETATANLNRQLSRGTLNKRYCAVVCGNPAEEGELVDYLRKNPNGKAEVVPAESDGAKKAVLRYRILESGADDIHLADIRIETGRFHQIRAQMAHAGLPLLGDVKYGSEYSIDVSGRLSVRNVALCAYELDLAHPVTRRGLHFQATPRGEVFQGFPEHLPK